MYINRRNLIRTGLLAGMSTFAGCSALRSNSAKTTNRHSVTLANSLDASVTFEVTVLAADDAEILDRSFRVSNSKSRDFVFEGVPDRVTVVAESAEATRQWPNAADVDCGNGTTTSVTATLLSDSELAFNTGCETPGTVEYQ